MKLLRTTPNLMVKDVKRTVTFYTSILGFTLLDSVPLGEDNFVFAIVQSGGVMLMFQEEQSIKEELPQLTKCSSGGCLTFYTNVEDVHKLYESLKDKVIIVKEIHETFYGSTDFVIEDCNGYILVFSQQGKE